MAGRLYGTYNFIDKDPIIYELRDLIEKSGVSHAEIERRSGVCVNTLVGWFYGNTKRPQHATIRAVMRAIGYDYRLVQVKTNNVVRLPVRARGGR